MYNLSIQDTVDFLASVLGTNTHEKQGITSEIASLPESSILLRYLPRIVSDCDLDPSNFTPYTRVAFSCFPLESEYIESACVLLSNIRGVLMDISGSDFIRAVPHDLVYCELLSSLLHSILDNYSSSNTDEAEGFIMNNLSALDIVDYIARYISMSPFGVSKNCRNTKAPYTLFRP